MTVKNNLEEFIIRLLSTEVAILDSEEGRDCIEVLLNESLKRNPNLSSVEWIEIKQDFVLYLLQQALNRNPLVMEKLLSRIEQ